jgi:riboflavin kinase/FMN adenylyltransferase
LGRPFALTGAVRAGAGRGRALLFPTLNLAPEQELLPKDGVYITETLLNGKVYGSATNVGTRPTVDGGAMTVESHLFGFSGEASPASIAVRFHRRLRDEMKFESVDALRAQIARDLETAQQFLRERVTK